MPDDGVFVVWNNDYYDLIKSVHLSLRNAVAGASDIYRVGFMRWDVEGIEMLQPEKALEAVEEDPST